MILQVLITPSLIATSKPFFPAKHGRRPLHDGHDRQHPPHRPRPDVPGPETRPGCKTADRRGRKHHQRRDVVSTSGRISRPRGSTPEADALWRLGLHLVQLRPFRKRLSAVQVKVEDVIFWFKKTLLFIHRWTFKQHYWTNIRSEQKIQLPETGGNISLKIFLETYFCILFWNF